MRRRDIVIIALGLTLGLALMVWPWVLNVLSSRGTHATISEVQSEVSALSEEDKALYFAQARAYNAQLAGEVPEIAADAIWPYAKQLTLDRDPMMSWLDIPTIAVSMPIYHGTSEATLMAGVGHLEGTSLPVGGASTHVVITAHSGMANLAMFDDIGKLEPGDLVLFHTMGKTLAYKMVSSEVVLPEETESLAIEPEADRVTLITCTPYGVNDHRLLVHCVRTTYDPDAAEAQRSLSARHFGMREIAAAVAVVVVAAIVVRLLVGRRRQKRAGCLEHEGHSERE